jgi:outer membrane receptor protein involved in Fe transport
MPRFLSLFGSSLLASRLLVAAAAFTAAPVLAQERAAPVNVPAMRLDQAVRVLGGQTGASIGFRDPALAALRSRPVRGRYTAEQALNLMLRGSGARFRRVATATFLVLRARAPVPARPLRPVRAPKPHLPPPPAVAGTDIVVTGTKRGVPLSVYAGSVQIIEGDRLSSADGARGSGAIEARVASVASTHQGQGRNKLFIRGIADSSFVGPTQATVGQYWGNSRITYSAPDPSLRLYDISSIEVLEGPQGTLYGAGSLGGVVRVVPRAPDLHTVGGAAWAGAQTVAHGQPGLDGGGILNLPLADDQLAFRAVVFGTAEGGYIDDLGRNLKDVNDVRSIGGRASLRYSPTTDWTFDASLVGQRIVGDDSQYAERGGSGLTRSSSVAQPYRNDFWLADIVARRQWGDLELTASIGYAHQYVFEQFDGVAFTPLGELVQLSTPASNRNDFVVTDDGEIVLSPTAIAPTAGITQANRIDMLTAETRLSRRGPNGTGWVVGASLLHNEAKVNRSFVGPFVGSSLTGVRNRVQEATLYGEGSIEPLPRLTFTLGARLTYSRLSGNAQDADEKFAFDVDPAARADRSETRLLPSASLAYGVRGGLTLFARYQQGFRPGGIAVRRDFIQRFKGDRVATTEAGLRHRGRAFDLTASASWTRWTDIQADIIDGFGFPTTANVGDGRILSVGGAARWRPLRGLEFDAALYLNRSKVTNRIAIVPIASKDGISFDLANANANAGSAPNPAGSITRFDRLPNIADVTGRAGFSYVTALTDDVSLETAGFARYVGKSTLGIGSILGQLQGDYVDTGLDFRARRGNRSVSLTISNLLDSKGNRFALGSPFLVRDRNGITPLQPRTVRLGFDLAF